MNGALIEHSEYDVDGRQCRGDEQWFAGERGLKCSRRSLKAAVNIAGQTNLTAGLLNRLHGVAERQAGP